MSAALPVRHVPVLLEETISWLSPALGQIWVDATVGAGGHARRLAELLGPQGCLIALDQDPGMLAQARARLAGYPVVFAHARFDQLPQVLQQHGYHQVDGLLADLGFATDQMDDAQRGMSFRLEGPLDMRFDPTSDLTAEEIVNTWTEKALAHLFWEYGEERYSRRVARQIVAQRRRQKLRTTTELAELVRRCVPRSGAIDPATRVFQALRIAVNDELGALDRLLAALPALIHPGGRVGFICFHSLEDRRVKQALRQTSLWQLLTRKPITPAPEEIARNPRARSARLRVAQRLHTPASPATQRSVCAV
jgi:16S rRNA (cytosine1402-N4)-methyltransferase